LADSISDDCSAGTCLSVDQAATRIRRFANRATAQGHVNLTGVDDPEWQ
jgi:hypothetical protein